MLPVLNPKSYDGARVLEASGRPIELKEGPDFSDDVLEISEISGKIHDSLLFEHMLRNSRLEECVKETLRIHLGKIGAYSEAIERIN